MLYRATARMRENFTSGSIPFRKAYLQSFIDVIEVDDIQIRIKGSKDVLEWAVLASQNGAIPGSQMSTEWRSLGKRRNRTKSSTQRDGWRAIQNKTTNSYAIEITM